MIEKLRKERKTIWHISIVLMMMLLVVFLVAPASAVPTCYSKYTPYHKVIDSVDEEYKDRLAFTYRIPQIGATIRIYVEYARTVTDWHYERTKTPRSWCTETRRCEISGDPVIQIGRYGHSYGRWTPIGYWIDES